ncbi:MAG: CDP-diacylglycerol--serine O-phosphatidyltransferase [Lysinibacillus sp.]
MPKTIWPTLLTVSNFTCGLLSIFAVLAGHFSAAIYYILFGLLFDVFDGWTARKLEASSAFGKELDSLSDIVTFGIAPAIFTYMFLLNELGQVGLILVIGYSVCAALRLARFNATQSDLPTFIGLPVPAAAMGLLLVTSLFSPMIVAIMICALSYLMISNMKFPHAKKRKAEEETVDGII